MSPSPPFADWLTLDKLTALNLSDFHCQMDTIRVPAHRTIRIKWDTACKWWQQSPTAIVIFVSDRSRILNGGIRMERSGALETTEDGRLMG